MQKIIVRRQNHRYPAPVNTTKMVETINDEPSKTDQSQAAETDVNNIVEKYNRTGQITHLAKHQGQFLDVSNIENLYEATLHVKAAESAFAELPAHLREKFNNEPINMIEFLQDSKNDDEAIELGLKVRKNERTDFSQPQPPVGKPTLKKEQGKKIKTEHVNNDDLNDDEPVHPKKK